MKFFGPEERIGRYTHGEPGVDEVSFPVACYALVEESDGKRVVEPVVVEGAEYARVRRNEDGDDENAQCREDALELASDVSRMYGIHRECLTV